MSLETTMRFNESWGDYKTNDRIRASKSLDVQKIDAENSLKNMALRFQYSPNQSTTKLWASDMINAGYTGDNIEAVCKSVPYKFEKHPTLNQLMELLVPYLPKVATSADELTDLSHRCYFHLKARFLKVLTQEQLTQMCKVYATRHFQELVSYNAYYQEMCVLNDWLRSYFGNGDKLMEQAVKTKEAFDKNDREYFLKTLRQYAKEHKL